LLFFRTVTPEEADGKLKEIYDHEIKAQEYIAIWNDGFKPAAGSLQSVGKLVQSYSF
jgi:hypothetical protein